MHHLKTSEFEGLKRDFKEIEHELNGQIARAKHVLKKGEVAALRPESLKNVLPGCTSEVIADKFIKPISQ